MKISHLLEAAALYSALFVFRLIGSDNASALGGWIGRTVGPLLGASRKARTNLENSLPDADHGEIIRGMWGNLGRVIAEYPHLNKIIHERVEISGIEHLEKIGKDKPFIHICGHQANWELLPLSMNYRLDSPATVIYREPNNPLAAKLLDGCRNFERKGAYIPKSYSGTREMVKILQQGGRLTILFDQKYNQGEPLEFFGRPAMTSTAPAQLALKFDIPILPMQIIREQNRFRIIIHPPLDTTGKDETAIMGDANRLLEGWVREHPAQWLWLHRRWNSKALQ